MPRKRVKDILSHTVGSSRTRREVLGQFTVSGLFGGSASTPASPSVSGVQDLFGGATGGSTNAVGEQVSALSKQLNDLKTAQQASLDSMLKNTQALNQNTVTKSSGSTANTAGSLVSSIFGSSLGLSPIVTGLLGLFGGSSTKTVQPLVPFTLPPSVQYQGGYTASGGGQVVPVDYGQSGARAAAPPPLPTVQIHVNAMDSRSFLDHSDDIARAVREAMLHSNSLNGVISDL